MLANYKEERAAFSQLLERQCQKPIFLLCGQSGCGKTSLLKHCRQSAQPEKVFLVFVDCKRDGINPAEVFSLAADHAGRDKLPVFSKCLRQHNVEISGNKIEGESNQISVVLGSGSEQERKERLVSLTNAWLDDIKQLDRPLLLVVDTYEQAEADLKSWLESVIARLPRACSKLRMVIAGQRIPDTNTVEDWASHCCEYELKGVHEPEHWLPVVEGLRKEVPGEHPLDCLRGICLAMQGNPAGIISLIRTFPTLP